MTLFSDKVTFQGAGGQDIYVQPIMLNSFIFWNLLIWMSGVKEGIIFPPKQLVNQLSPYYLSKDAASSDRITIPLTCLPILALFQLHCVFNSWWDKIPFHSSTHFFFLTILAYVFLLSKLQDKCGMFNKKMTNLLGLLIGLCLIYRLNLQYSHSSHLGTCHAFSV